MQIREVMTKKVVTISPDQPISEAIALMQTGGFRRLPVVEEGRLVGIVTDRDLRLATNSPLVLREKWYSDYMLEAVKVKSCMTPDPITVTSETPVLEAVRLMRRKKFGGLPVVDGDELVGVFSETDAMDCLIKILERDEAATEPIEEDTRQEILL